MALYYGKQQGYVFEYILTSEIARVLGRSEVIEEDEIKKRYGMCVSDGKNCIGVDIACSDGKYVYLIQCKQVKMPSPVKHVNQFLDYCNHMQKKIKVPIVPIWASSVNPCKSGIDLCDRAGVKRIIYPTTDSLVTNVVSYITDRKEIVDDSGDWNMI